MSHDVHRLGSHCYLWHKPIIYIIRDISTESNREFFLMQIYFFLLNVHVHMKLGNNASE